MYSTSSAYKTEIKKPSRSFECKITIGDRIYNNSDIVNVVIDSNIQPSDGFMIGTTVSKTLDLTLINSGDTIYSTSQIKVEIGLKIGATIEYIPMGLFNIDDIEKTDYTTKITAFDNMIKFESAYFSILGDNPTLQQVVNELAAKTGVQFTGSLPAYTVKKLEGFTCREIVGYVASICGGNAVITRDGKFTTVAPADVSLSMDGSNYINYKREEVKYKVGKVTCKVGEEELSKGSLGTDSMELGFENPWVTDAILQDIYNKLNGFNYLGYSMKWQGDLSVDVGDIITVTDVKGVVRKHPVLSQKFNYTGGLTAEIGAKGENKNKNSFSSSGDTSKKLNRVVTEVAIVNKAFVDYAHINDADIVNLKAQTAKIGIVEAEVGNINTILSKSVFTELATVGQIVAGSSIIANEAIGDAQIANLKVGKLLAGDLSTSKFKIISDSGNMLISDNTIQIKDSSRVRVQIGKDASNDYNMYVWDSTGNLMFDATGLKASGIKSKIIRDDMVSDTANISGNKIEKESLVSQINGATTTLKASKIRFDDINQTLDIAFNSLKTTIYDTGQTVSSQGTLIGTLQGQITTKIWQTDITTAINNVVIGGRNLAQKTSDIYIDATGFTGATNDGRFPYTVLIRDLNVGDNVTVSFTFKYSNLTYNNTSRGMRIQGRGNVTGWGNGAFNSYSIPIDFNAGTGEINVSYRMIITADHLLNSFWDINFRTDFITGGTISVKSLMIEKGNKKTTWTRALEDLDTKISENYSSITQTINGINTTVGSMQTSISGHETRIGTAEGSISTMKDQIFLKVEKADIYNIAGLVTKIDDRDASLIYTGTWTRGNDPGHYNTTYSYSATANLL
ncbi:hypothetical protein [Clostridium intestinale]|uniref:hypothetical protein n=1 Tax=Clostridium intestinale TaxID=36845 RepID=UPI002DD62845|nr:hypothetical protein [Clostridium intestinale]WRY53109.1 hypothetical protein P8F83_07860 [Clostridium intestinale]